MGGELHEQKPWISRHGGGCSAGIHQIRRGWRRSCTTPRHHRLLSVQGCQLGQGPCKWRADCKGKYPGTHASKEVAAEAYTNYGEHGVLPKTPHNPTATSQFKGVSWIKSRGQWRAVCKGTNLGCHATEEAAARAYTKYLEDGVDPVKRRGTSSQLPGVSWDKGRGKWRADCKGTYLGSHATEEAAARAYNNYVEDGFVPVPPRDPTCSSQFKGVFWDSRGGKWLAKCKGKRLGSHATEEVAMQAYDKYVKDGVDPVRRRDTTSSRFKGVFWDKSRGKWGATYKEEALGHHVTEAAAALAYDDYVKDGIDPLQRREGTSPQFKGVSWDKRSGKWVASCKGKNLGHHATEEVAAQAIEDYVKDSVDLVQRRDGSSSQFMGVCWDKRAGKWKAQCKGTNLGLHATEEAAARAYNIEAECLGLFDLNVIPPAGDADDGNNTCAPTARALHSPAAPARAHAGAGSKRSKRASAPTKPAPAKRKKMRLDASAGADAGGGEGGLVVEAQEQH